MACALTAFAPAQELSGRDRALLAEARHLWSTLAEDIWPGTSRVEAPFVYIQGDHEFAIGFPRSIAGFRDTSGELFGKPVQVRKRVFGSNMTASFPVDGVPAVVIGAPESTGRTLGGWLLTAGHEMFHVFQAANNSYAKVAAAQIGPADDASWHLTFPFPYSDADVMRLVHLQGYLVWLAGQSPAVEDSIYNIGAALDAVAVYRDHLTRMQGNDKSYRYSQFQEWNEGGAAYFEYRLAQKAAAGAYRPTDAYAALPEFEPYANIWRNQYEARPFLTKHAGRAAKSRSAFYHLGTGKALALDKVYQGWKARYFVPGLWFDDLLAEAMERTR